MQIPRVATWKHVKYLSGIFRPIGSHANPTHSHVKTREIPFSNLQTYWKPYKYHAQPPENTCNTYQESSDLLEAMQIQRVATWKHVKYLSGIFRPIGSHGNTTRSHVKTCEIPFRNLQSYWKPCKYHENTWNTFQESSDLLEAIQIPRAATWKHVQYLSGIFKSIGSHANTTGSHVKTRELPLRNLQTYWKPCKYHA